MKILINFGIEEKNSTTKTNRIESRNGFVLSQCDVLCSLVDGIAVPFGCVAAHSMPLVIVFSFLFTYHNFSHSTFSLNWSTNFYCLLCAFECVQVVTVWLFFSQFLFDFLLCVLVSSHSCEHRFHMLNSFILFVIAIRSNFRLYLNSWMKKWNE